MVDAVYRGNIEELLSVINHLKKYIIAFVIVVLVLISVIHFSKYSVHVVPLVTVTLVLLPAVYYTTVLVLKFITTSFVDSNQTGEITTMNGNGNRQGLKTPDLPYPKSPTPPPSYEEATRNDYYHNQPQPWLPSTSSGFACGGVPTGLPPVFNVQYQYNTVVSNRMPVTETTVPNPTSPKVDCAPPLSTRTATMMQNIPSVTITIDNDQRPMEI